MSLRPLLFSNWWEDLEHPHSVMDQYFGDGIHHDAFHLAHQAHQPYAAIRGPLQFQHRGLGRCPTGYPRQWTIGRNPGASTVKPDKDSFHVSLDVQQFTPEEISVKVVDRSVIVEGKHEDKRDEHGWIARQFCRKYDIPEQCDIELIQPKLSSDGVLSIIVPRKTIPKVEGEKVIPIVHTGKPAIVDTPTEKKKEAANGVEAS